MDCVTSEKTKIHEENLNYRMAINTQISEENTITSDENFEIEKNTQATCETSKESEINQENIGSKNQNHISLNHSHSVDVSELIMKNNYNKEKGIRKSNTTPDKPRSRQERLDIEKLKNINLDDLTLTERKGLPSNGILIKGSNAKKKSCSSKQRNKVHFQKFKKPDEMKNNSSKSACKEADSVGRHLSPQNISEKNVIKKVNGINKQLFTNNNSNTNDCKGANSSEKQLSTQRNACLSVESAVILESPSNIESDISNLTQSKHLLDYGFKHLKEEMKALIQQCVEKEDTIASLEKRLKETDQAYSDMKKNCLHLEQKNEKLAKNLEESTKKHEKASQELYMANAFITETKQAKKMADNTISDIEKRLGQILAQNSKLKSQLDATSLGGKNAQMSSQKRIEELTETNKLLTRQKSELREVVIKQMQLVNNLKRQLLHLKAAMAQNYTEQEVSKVIDDFY